MHLHVNGGLCPAVASSSGRSGDETLNEMHDRQSSIQIFQKLKTIFLKGWKRVVNQSSRVFHEMLSKTAH